MAWIRTYRDILLLPLAGRSVLISGFAIALAAMVFYTTGKPAGDYANYYYGSRYFMDGIQVSAIYDPASFNELIVASGGKGIFADYAPVTPFTLLFYCPFAAGGIAASKILFNLFSCALFLFSLYRFIVFQNIKASAAAAGLAIILVPVYSNILLGQSYLILLALMLEGYVSLVKGKKLQTSLCFSLPIVLKIFPAIVLLWLFLSDKRKVFVLTLLFSSLLFVSVIPFTGTELIRNYLSSTLPRLMQGEINDPFSLSYQSMAVFLRRLFVYDAQLNPHPVSDSFLSFALLNLLFTAYFLNAYIQDTIRHTHVPFHTFGRVLFTGFLVSGYGTTYSLVLLLPLWFSEEEKEGWDTHKKLLCLLLFLTATFFPVSKADVLPDVLQSGRLYTMLLLFFFMYPIRELRIFNVQYTVLVLLLLIPVLYALFQPKDKSDYYLEKEPSLLLTDYKPIPAGIRILYAGRTGLDSLILKTGDYIRPSDRLQLRNNQIWYEGKQITAGNDIKKEPVMLLNNHQVLYLSDANRGVGLTTLRKMDLVNR